mmetsp:Transcript_54150/g.131400  ORF Transcript_54150/g.131400 Transcript_54150/m.131400 type:complete len:90 (-) Transcript_54150:127-396(-)
MDRSCCCAGGRAEIVTVFDVKSSGRPTTTHKETFFSNLLSCVDEGWIMSISSDSILVLSHSSKKGDGASSSSSSLWFRQVSLSRVCCRD